jgi:hypothetical protein
LFFSVAQESIDARLDEARIALGEEDENLRKATFDYNVRMPVDVGGSVL